jgi:amidase
MSGRSLVAITVIGALLFSGCLGAAGNLESGSVAKRVSGMRTDLSAAQIIQENRPAVCMDSVRGVNLQTATMGDLQVAMAQGRLTAVDLVDAYYARFLAYDEAGPKLNSIQVFNPAAWETAEALDAERKDGNVRGPLHGIPIILKDNVGTKDMPTTAGSLALAGNQPSADATIVARLREAGAIILGKAQLSEFANWVDPSMPSGYSSLGGQVINAYNWSRTPSGSSSGSGVLTSMALSAGSIGSETSGSILSPSNANSVVGVKPTMGLLSRAGIIPLAENFDVPGPMVRNVYDAAGMLGAMAGEDPADPKTAGSDDRLPEGGDYIAALVAQRGKERPLDGVRLGYVNPGGAPFEEARAVLASLGAEIVQIQTNQLSSASSAEGQLIYNEFHYGINDYLAHAQRLPNLITQDLTGIILFNNDHPNEMKYGQRTIIQSDANAGSKEQADALALPVIAAARRGADMMFDDSDVDAIIGQNAPHTGLGAAAGYPTVTVPAGYTGDGSVPVGVSFFGKAFTEDRLLAYAYAYEQATHKRIPPTVQNPKNVEGVCAGEPAPAPSAPALDAMADPEFPTEADLVRGFLVGMSGRDGLLELP